MKKKSTILFYTYYGNRYGTGHLYRDVQLGKMLSRSFRIFYSVRGSKFASKIVLQKSSILSSNLKKALRKAKPDLLIHDQPYDMGALPKFFYPQPLSILGLDYFFYTDTRFHAIINLTNKYQHGKSTIPRVYEGLEYAIIRPAIKKLRSTSPRKSVKSLLVAFGGVDLNNHTSKVLKALSFLKGNYTITVILGPLFRQKKKVEQDVYRGAHAATIKQGLVELAPFLSSADVVIGGSGATLMEALSIGKPYVTIPQSVEENDFLRDSNLNQRALVIGCAWSAKRIAEVLKTFFADYKKRRQYASRGKSRIDGNGLERIAQIIKSIA